MLFLLLHHSWNVRNWLWAEAGCQISHIFVRAYSFLDYNLWEAFDCKIPAKRTGSKFQSIFVTSFCNLLKLRTELPPYSLDLSSGKKKKNTVLLIYFMYSFLESFLSTTLWILRHMKVFQLLWFRKDQEKIQCNLIQLFYIPHFGSLLQLVE